MPKVPRNGYLNGSDFRHPATVRYGCNIGYVLSSGDTERQCNSKGKWTGWAPACARKLGYDWFTVRYLYCDCCIQGLDVVS